MTAGGWRTWRAAMADALYGPGGFYLSQSPAAHFRTSVHASPLFAAAVAELARRAGLGTVVDLGAGQGELLLQLHALDPDLALHGVDVRPRPDGLPESVGWSDRLPTRGPVLVVANEWLDTVPLDVVERAGGRTRLVLVDRHGAERPGPSPEPADADWLDRWWPRGRRAEVGRSRDEAWAGLLAGLAGLAGLALPAAGRPAAPALAVAVDYAHRRADRPAAGTLTGYRRGRQVPPVPDGSCDLTAHLAVDSCAAAGLAAGATGSLVLTQRDALGQLGVRGRRPDPATATTDPVGYLRGLERAGQAGELTDPDGLGGFWWLVQSVGLPIPLEARPALAERRPTPGSPPAYPLSATRPGDRSGRRLR